MTTAVLLGTQTLSWQPRGWLFGRQRVRRGVIEDDDGLLVSEATTVSQALAEFWRLADVRFPEASGSPADDVMADALAVSWPECSPLNDGRIWSALFEHLECCKDACDNYGTRLAALPSSDGEARAIVMRRVFGASSMEEDDDEDDWDLSPELAAKLAQAMSQDVAPAQSATLVYDSNASDADILAVTKRWVEAIISAAGVCPFSVSAEKAGLPVGVVHYAISRATTAEAAYADYWEEVVRIQSQDQRTLSTTLLVLADRFWTDNLEGFETFGTSLAQALESKGLGFENDLQLVFFHPLHVFRDGRERAGADKAANFARRSPYPMVNILRTSQVRQAQKSLPTALVYAQNEV